MPDAGAMRRWRVALVAVALASVPVACREGRQATVAAPPEVARSTEDYRPGVAADVFLPHGTGPVPLVVMVPGGAWRTADRSGLTPLADRLAAAGMAVVNATHRAAAAGAVFPTEVDDVVCSVDFAVARASAAGRRPRVVVVLGHSSGAHLAALAALAGGRFRRDCSYPRADVGGLAGLAGLYDVAAVPDVAEPLFGVAPADDPGLWREGNAMAWVGERPSLPVFLAHGDRDELVPVHFTAAFAGALEAAGHPVRVEIVPGAGHHDIYRPEVIATPLIEWIESLPASPG